MKAGLRTDLTSVSFEIDSITHNAEPLARHGFPGYFATKLGKIISTRKGKCRVLKPSTTHNGYERVELWSDSQKRGIKKRVHQLIAIAFFSPPDPDKDGTPRTQVNHKDTGKENNKAANLEWSSGKENAYHLKVIEAASREKALKATQGLIGG